jgi:hypothetical protein
MVRICVLTTAHTLHGGHKRGWVPGKLDHCIRRTIVKPDGDGDALDKWMLPKPCFQRRCYPELHDIFGRCLNVQFS